MITPQYGCEVGPAGPQQDMAAIDHIAGGDALDRSASPATFTGGTTGAGLGGTAIPAEKEMGDRIGF